MIGNIDEMFWELEDFNLRQVGWLPSDVRGRVAEVIGAATGRLAEEVPVQHKTALVLDMLFDTQEDLIILRGALTGRDPSSPTAIEHIGGRSARQGRRDG